MSEDRLSFAVIIPVYNGADFIQRAIESCLLQTALPDEIIVIDDASNDDTAGVIRSLNSDLIKYECNKTKRGPSFCRNRGMELASTSWFLFLDADDIFHPNKIEIVRYQLTRKKDIFILGHSFDLIGGTRLDITNEWKQLQMKNMAVKSVLMKNPAVTPSLAVFAGNKVRFNEEMVYAEDHDFILRTTEQFGFWYLDMPLCSLQRLPLTPGGISDNKWKMRKGEMSMYMDYCKRHHKYLSMPFLLLFSLMKHIKNTVISVL